MKSEKPERKQQAASWRVYKSDAAAANGNVTYVMIIDPAVKDADYNIVNILNEAFPAEIQALFKAYTEVVRQRVDSHQPRARRRLRESKGSSARAEGTGRKGRACTYPAFCPQPVSERQIQSRHRSAARSVPRVALQVENPIVDARAKRAGRCDLCAAAGVQQKGCLLIVAESLAIVPRAGREVELKAGMPTVCSEHVARRRPERRASAASDLPTMLRVLELEPDDEQADADGESARDRSSSPASCVRGTAWRRQRADGAGHQRQSASIADAVCKSGSSVSWCALYQRRDKFRRLSALADLVVAGDARAIARGISLVENDGDEAAGARRASCFAASGRAFLVGRHRRAGRGQEHARRRAGRALAQGRPTRRRHCRRSDEPVQRRRDARRSRPHAGARAGRRRVHPQHGDARTPRRARAGDRGRRARARRGRQGHRRHRDRRRRPGRSRDRAHRRCLRSSCSCPGWATTCRR